MSAIRNGKLDPAAPLPSVRKLAAMFEVSPATAHKTVQALCAEGVLEAREREGIYLKSFLPAAPKTGRKVGMVFLNSRPDIKSDRWPGVTVRALVERLGKLGLKPEMLLLPLAELRVQSFIESLRDRRLRGLVLFELDTEFLLWEFRQHLSLPMISVDLDARHAGIPSVVFDNRFGVFQATRHLISLGHRRIVFMRPLARTHLPADQMLLPDVIETERQDGYEMAMKDAGLQPCVVEHEDRGILPDGQTYREEARRLLKGRRPSTAFVFTGDDRAREFIRAGAELGLLVPKHFSVIGFGGSPTEFEPGRQVGSVRVDYRAMGIRAAELMAEVVKGDVKGPRYVTIPARTVPNDSVGKAKSR